MEGTKYSIKVSKEGVNEVTPARVDAKGLLQLLGDRTIPAQIPVEQIKTLYAENPDPHHVGHLNAGLLYAAVDLQSTPGAQEFMKQQGLERCSTLSLVAIGQEVLGELVRDEYGLQPPEEACVIRTPETHLEGVSVMRMSEVDYVEPGAPITLAEQQANVSYVMGMVAMGIAVPPCMVDPRTIGSEMHAWLKQIAKPGVAPDDVY